MNTKFRRATAASLMSVALMGSLAACGEAAVDKSEVEKQIKTRLEKTNSDVGDVKCDDDLKAKEGATTDCEAEVKGTKQKMQAVVTKVDGKNVTYNIRDK